MPELAPSRRLALLALGYGLYVLGGPGQLTASGTPLASLGLVPWVLATSRPGPFKKTVEGLAGGLALVLQTTWMGIVFWFAIPWLLVGYACWSIWGGWLSKRLARRLPLALVAPLAWVGFESLLAWTPPPIGLSWLRLGHYAADWPLLAGSGRVWGVAGIGFVLAAVAGLIADLVRVRRIPGAPPAGLASWIAGALPACLALVLALVVPAPAAQPGPGLLLVQPAFEQARKQSAGTPEELLRDSWLLTRDGMLAQRASGGGPPDLVCWGETMMPYPLVGPGLASEIEGLEVDPWHPWASFEPRRRGQLVEMCGSWEEALIELLYRAPADASSSAGAAPVLTERTSFLTGVEVHVAQDGRLRRTNSVVLWGADGERRGVGRKVHLAPGGETMVGLERLAWVRDVIYEVAGYVPDFLAGEEAEVIELPNADGDPWRFGATVCFDNAFGDVYAGPLRRGPLDFHLVVSNEAWYEDSQELDQMIAFSRLHAICTGRAFVRCANSGVSAAFDAEGRELARLVVDGRDREVPGTLFVDVPVPVDGGGRTPFVHLQPWLLPLFALVAALLALTAGRGEKKGSEPG